MAKTDDQLHLAIYIELQHLGEAFESLELLKRTKIKDSQYFASLQKAKFQLTDSICKFVNLNVELYDLGNLLEIKNFSPKH